MYNFNYHYHSFNVNSHSVRVHSCSAESDQSLQICDDFQNIGGDPDVRVGGALVCFDLSFFFPEHKAERGCDEAHNRAFTVYTFPSLMVEFQGVLEIISY